LSKPALRRKSVSSGAADVVLVVLVSAAADGVSSAAVVVVIEMSAVDDASVEELASVWVLVESVTVEPIDAELLDDGLQGLALTLAKAKIAQAATTARRDMVAKAVDDETRRT
jgi:hypothetical protein